MGLFSSEYRTTVSTSVSRVVRDATIIPSTKTGLISSLFGDDGDQLVETVLDSVLASMGIRTERMYTYAKANFPVGLPTGKVSTSIDGKEVVLGVIRSLTAPSTVFDYYHLGPLNNLHVGWVKLFNDYGYNSVTNQLATLSASVGYPVYLKDMVAVVKEATVDERGNGSLDQWGSAAKSGFTPERPAVSEYLRKKIVPTPFHLDGGITDDFVRVTYVWAVPTPTVISGTTVTRDVIHEATLDLDISAYDRTQDYFHVKYRTTTQDGYWIYKFGAGTYPEIDSIFDLTPATPGEFFPNIYFRLGTTNLGANTTTPEYKAASRMMKTLGMDYQSICDAVHDNPEIAAVEQALLTFAVPANTTNPVEQRYLFEFFNKLYLAAGGIGVGDDWDNGNVDTVASTIPDTYGLALLEALSRNELGFQGGPRIRISIQDSRLNTALSCQSIFKRKRAGIIAAVGGHTSSFTTRPVTYSYTTYGFTGFNPLNGEMMYGDIVNTATKDIDVFVYSHQLTDAVYEEIAVYDLQMTYYMWGGYYTIGNDLSPILLVPLDRAITYHYSTSDRELLYTRAMHYVFNARNVTEVAWYQQAWFGDLLIAVAIVVTVLSLGSDGGFSVQLAGVLAGKIAITTFIMGIVTAVIKQVIMAAAAKLFVKAVGVDIAFLAAIVAAIYGGYSALKAGSIQGAPWAKELLASATSLTSRINTVMSEAMTGLKREADAFNLLSKEKMSLLDDTKKLLEQQTLLSPLLVFGESPDDFYNRTVHSGNIGILGIDSIASYVDIALTLPKFNDSIGSNNHALSV